MKVQFLIGDTDEEEDFEWRDLYLDENEIKGCYLPDIDENIKDKTINVMFNGSHYTFMQEEYLLKFLSKKFNIR